MNILINIYMQTAMNLIDRLKLKLIWLDQFQLKLSLSLATFPGIIRLVLKKNLTQGHKIFF